LAVPLACAVNSLMSAWWLTFVGSNTTSPLDSPGATRPPVFSSAPDESMFEISTFLREPLSGAKPLSWSHGMTVCGETVVFIT
jgi:hypothetical protein